jgi:hypothetical protein
MCLPDRPCPYLLETASIPILYTTSNLLIQYSKLYTICQLQISPTEKEIALTCMRVIKNNMEVICKQVQLARTLSDPANFQIPHLQKNTLLLAQLWLHLSFPHATNIRQLTYEIILLIENIINISSSRHTSENFSKPKHPNKPSLTTQIVTRPIEIINPYLLSLQRNYYYPIAYDPVEMSEETSKLISETTSTAAMDESVSHSPPISPLKLKAVQPEEITVDIP